jgi:NitT/TauT family transport system ATP-binding protein
LVVPFPHPRNRLDPAFREMVDGIYALMTRRTPIAGQKSSQPAVTTSTALHPVSTNLMAGLLETLVAPPYDGRADLPALAGALQLEADELLPLGEALQLLRFGNLEEGDLLVTDTGRQFVAADTDPRKALFGAALRAHVPLVAQIRQVLDERWNHRASAVRFRDELEDVMSPEYADETMKAAITWGRYAEIYSYDEDADQFYLDEDEN